MAGYVRQDTLDQIADGNTVEAATHDAEFDAIVGAFSSSSGHKHDGTIGEGAAITTVGPVQDVVITPTTITPKTDNTISLGTTALEFKDLWIDGNANIDNLIADAGTVAGSAITTAANTQTLTNKTIDLTNNTLVATSAQLAAALTNETGTGVVVFSDSPALTGVPTVPTAAAGTNTTQVASTAHVFAERVNASTLTNKTINLANNTLVATSAQMAAAVTDETGLGSLVFSVSPALTGTPTAPTAAANTNTTQLATTAHVFAERTNSSTLTNKTLTAPVINGGTITGITDLAIADGGTGASTAAAARTSLGLEIGTDVQAYDAGLASIAGVVTVADRMLYTTGVDTWASAPITTFGRSLIDDANNTAARTTLGLGTIATQDANAVTLTGGTITGITDLTVADGGTGASTASAARTNLGLVIGTDVQAQDATLQSVADLTTSGWLTRSGPDVFTRTFQAGSGINIATPSGGAGDPTFSVTGLATTNFAASTIVTAAETILSNDNDTTLPTSAAVLSHINNNPWRYESAEQAVTLSSVVTLTHGLGSIPKDVRLVLRCKTAQAPYAVDDEIPVADWQNAGVVYGAQLRVGPTQIRILTGAGGHFPSDAAGSWITLINARWVYVVYAR